VKALVTLAPDTAESRGATYADVRCRVPGRDPQGQERRRRGTDLDDLIADTDEGSRWRPIEAGRSTTDDSTSGSVPGLATRFGTESPVRCSGIAHTPG